MYDVRHQFIRADMKSEENEVYYMDMDKITDDSKLFLRKMMKSGRYSESKWASLGYGIRHITQVAKKRLTQNKKKTITEYMCT